MMVEARRPGPGAVRFLSVAGDGDQRARSRLRQLAQRLRRLPHMAQATLIAITGYGQEADRARTAEAGFDHHFVKPVDLEALLGVLERAPRVSAA